jgi:hypothetical protein
MSEEYARGPCVAQAEAVPRSREFEPRRLAEPYGSHWLPFLSPVAQELPQTGLLSSAWRSPFRARPAWDRPAGSRSASPPGAPERACPARVDLAWGLSLIAATPVARG